MSFQILVSDESLCLGVADGAFFFVCIEGDVTANGAEKNVFSIQVFTCVNCFFRFFVANSVDFFSFNSIFHSLDRLDRKSVV